ncbi:MAG TPA: ribonucleotide reductase, partial [Caulobacteraceae bacterium]|nr:ribonucleotide reductase [Caulobacteraceae bacterium]
MTADSRPVLEQRELELADRMVTVAAPAHWPDARLEAWLEEGEVRLAKYPKALFDSIVCDQAAPATFDNQSAQVVDVEAVEFEAGLARHVGAARAAEAASATASLIAERLTGVINAFARCEGGAEACADPRKNAALGRAARTAREAGAPDELIERAIALAKTGEQAWTVAPADTPPLTWLIGVSARDLAEAGGGAPARLSAAGWETGKAVLALHPRDAEAAEAALAAPKAAIDVRAFFRDGRSDIDGFKTAVALWCGVLDERTGGDGRPLALTLAGIADHLIARGLAYDSDEGRGEAAALFALAAGAAFESSATRAASEGPCRDFEAEPKVILEMVEERLQAARRLPKGEFASAAVGALSTALKAARRHGLRNRQVVALYDDPVLALRLGARLGTAPWAGPVAISQSADGEVITHLSAAAMDGLLVVGAEIDEAMVTALGTRTLSDAPGVDHAALKARGFTDHELAIIEQALVNARSLREAFDPAAIDPGFLRDVVGIDTEALEDRAFDLLREMGFDAGQIFAAEAYALGTGDLSGFSPVFANDIGLDSRLAMTASVETFT